MAGTWLRQGRVRWFALAAAIAVVAGAAVTYAAVSSPGHHRAELSGSQVPPASSTTSTPAAQRTTPTESLIATLTSSVTTYASPGGPPSGSIPPTWHSAASALPVIAEQGQWLQVRLAPRPNGSTAWIQRAGSVSLTETPYRIVVDLGTRHLELFRSEQMVLDAPIGIGTPDYPTPTGHFFLAFFAQSPSSGYGPFVMVTSAHSEKITDWDSSGDALVAIHGPLGADAAIGTTGAAVSHGCIRLHVSDLEQLRAVPAGSPIDIVAG